MSIPGVDLLDLDRFQRLEHHAMFERLRQEAPVYWTDHPLPGAQMQTLARIQCAPERLATLTLTIAQSVGVPSGIVAGQAWECESQIDLAHYHRAKTGALFAAATVAGAASAGADSEPWRMVGEKLGEVLPHLGERPFDTSDDE